MSPSGSRALLEKILQLDRFKPEVPKQPIVLFGAGDLASMAVPLLVRYGLQPYAVTGENTERGTTDEILAQYWRNLEDLADASEDYTVAIALAKEPFGKMVSDVRPYFPKSRIVHVYDLLEALRGGRACANGWVFSGSADEVWSQVVGNLELLSDDTSRAHYLNAVAWHWARLELDFERYPLEIRREIGGNYWKFLRVSEPKFVRLLDIGAGQGSVFREVEAQKLLVHRSSCYTAVEPDSQNFQKLMQATAHSDVANLRLFNTAVGNRSNCSPFWSNLGLCSQFAPGGSDMLAVEDAQLFLDQPTHIKIHAESSDLEILRSLASADIWNSTQIAVTCYHAEQHLIQIPQVVASLCGGVLVRQHAHAGTGVVAYGNSSLT